MPKLTHSQPSYRLNKPSGRAVVTLNGADYYYLGWHGTPESRAEYDRLIATRLANGRAAAAHGQRVAARVLEIRGAVLRKEREAQLGAGVVE